MRSEPQHSLSFASHEFLTPLTGLRNILELLVEGVLADDEVTEFLVLALDAVKRLERLADRIEADLEVTTETRRAPRKT